MPLPLTISCSSKSRLVLPSWFLPFWYLFTRVVPDKFQKSSKTTVCVCVLKLLGVRDWTPLAHWINPQAVVNFIPLTRSPQPHLLLIEYYFVIAVIIYWITGPTRKWCCFKIQNLKLCWREALPNPSGIEDGPLSTQYTCVSQLDRLWHSTPQLFLNNSNTDITSRKIAKTCATFCEFSLNLKK